MQAKADAQAEAHAEQRKQSAAEAHRTAERMTKAEADQKTARKDAATAREAAAKLAGQLEALTAQNAAFLSAIQTRQVEPTDKKI